MAEWKPQRNSVWRKNSLVLGHSKLGLLTHCYNLGFDDLILVPVSVSSTEQTDIKFLLFSFSKLFSQNINVKYFDWRHRSQPREKNFSFLGRVSDFCWTNVLTSLHW